MAGILGLFAQGTQAGHMLLIEHAICAEHGELVHGEAHHAEKGRGFELASDEGIALSPSSAGDEAHAHEHCGTVSERQDAVAQSVQTGLPFARLDRAVTHDPKESARARNEARLSFAPKTSPPAC